MGRKRLHNENPGRGGGPAAHGRAEGGGFHREAAGSLAALVQTPPRHREALGSAELASLNSLSVCVALLCVGTQRLPPLLLLSPLGSVLLSVSPLQGGLLQAHGYKYWGQLSNDPSTPKTLCVLVLSTWDCVTLQGKRDSAGVIKLRAVRW